MIGFFTTIIIGMVAGYVAARVMNRDQGIFKSLVVGVIGATLGSFIAGLLDIDASSFIGQLIVASLGAILFLFIYDRIKASKSEKSGKSDKHN